MSESLNNPKGCNFKFWLCFLFAFLLLIILCCILCKLKEISHKVDNVDACCKSVVVNDEICNDEIKIENTRTSLPEVVRKNFNGRLKLPVTTINQPYYCNQVVVYFKPGYDTIISRRYLEDSLKLKKIKACPNCDNIEIELWGTDGDTPINPETKGKITKSEIEPLGGDGAGIIASLNYNIKLPATSEVFITDEGVREWKEYSEAKKNVKIALIDTGIDFQDHGDLMNFQWKNTAEIRYDKNDDDGNCIVDDNFGYDFVNNRIILDDIDGHGTHIAGIISKLNSGDPSVFIEIMDLKIFHESQGNLFNLVCAMKYAISKKVDIINLSLGFYSSHKPMVLDTILEITNSHNILVVTSSGNDGENNNLIVSGGHYPSDFGKPNMLAVAALKQNRTEVWESANYGQNLVNIAAPGEFVKSTYYDGQYAAISGTSMAAGHVSGIAAAAISDLGWTTMQARDKIICASIQDELSSVGKTVGGNLNKCGLVNYYQNVRDCQ